MFWWKEVCEIKKLMVEDEEGEYEKMFVILVYFVLE